MNEPIQLIIDEDSVNFTEDGMVSVLDVIHTMLDAEGEACIWEQIKSENPEILSYCEERHVKNDRKEPVMNSEGWDYFQELLFNRMLALGER
jgi:hypothetical protein